MGSTSLNVRLRTPGGDQVWLGPDYDRGIVPEAFTASADEHGPLDCSFMLRRRTRQASPDLKAFNRCEVHIGGVPVWAGRIWETPTSDDDTISVQGKGAQFHLDDRLILRFYVQTDMTAYVDSRAKATTTLGPNGYRAGLSPGVGAGVIVLPFPKDFVIGVGDRCGVTLDTGQSGISRVVVAWEALATDGNNALYSRASASENGWNPADDGSAVLSSASGTISHSPSARRYHHLFVIRNASAGTLSTEQGARITSVKLFGSTSWESGGSSAFKASDAFLNVLGAALPLLSTSTARISTTSFPIPDFQPDGYRSPREILQAANAFHDWLWGVDARWQLFFRARPTVPLYEMGAWSGSPFSDASPNSAEELHNEVIVQYTDSAGVQQNEVRTAVSGLLAQQGFTRSKVLAVQAALTQAAAQQIGDVWLASRTKTPLRGGANAMRGSVRTSAGAPVHPAHLLLGVGERLRLTDRVNPDTGGMGRDGTIVAVRYSHDSETASLQVDDPNDRLDTLLARLAVVTGQVR